MPQVRRGLGELGGISITERTKADGSVVYVARAKGRRLDGRDISLEATGPSRRAAERKLRERWDARRGERSGQTPPRPGEVAAGTSSTRLTSTSTLAEVTRAWLTAEETNLRTRPQTKKTYRTTAERHILPALGGLRLNEITAGTITDHLRDLRGGPTPSAVESTMTVLRRVAKFAAQRGLVSGDLLFGVDIPPKIKKETAATRETVTPAETVQVLDLADGHSPTLGLVMRVIAETGARPGEVLALHPGQLHPAVDTAPPYIELHGTVIGLVTGGAYRQAESKTETSRRFVTVTPATMDRLLLAADCSAARFAEPEAETGLRPIFPTRDGGWKTVHTINAELRKALDGTPLAGISPRVSRRTLATAVAAQAGDQTAAQLLGHARVSVTGRHYIKPGVTVRDGASALTQYLGEDAAE
ncbi:site-specific integrase [Corynebacterium sp. P3-F1]|uniref:tyrosine-type recombinase/integrase n=1 Tax=Corynebacterium sp. P3-F1 TaxID=3059080 RepID=UPI00265D4886|nr:site-specific integrase [Corynebacterium sp. P3-F1]WKK61201.1 site-specific integrase [Corynebacterium sp. P3-F1]